MCWIETKAITYLLGSVKDLLDETLTIYFTKYNILCTNNCDNIG